MGRAAKVTITSASSTEAVPVFGTTHTIKVRHTAYTVIECAGEPGSGLPPHALEDQDQSIYVLAGQYHLVTGDDTRPLSPGSIAFVARGTVHSLTVSGTEPARCLTIVNPHGAWETFLDDLRAVGATTGVDDVCAIARRAGIALLTSSV
jgi:quercetin dioxygenase-like cupin family protein